MSGETEASVSGWTIDTLHTHFLELLATRDAVYAERDRKYQQRFDDEDRALAVLRTSADGPLAHVRSMMDERDKRYEQRFLAQEHAVEIALAAVTREFHEHLLQVERETRAAFDSSEKAILKAENAAEKRFESVNEFRAQLAAQARDLMPRLETEQRLDSMSKEVDTLTDRVNLNAGRINEDDRRRSNAGIIPAIVFGAIGSLLGIAGFVAALLR